jgi:hypothetical protein
VPSLNGAVIYELHVGGFIRHPHIRGLGWKLSVVVLTGNLYEALRVKCQQLGAVAVLDKFNGLNRCAEALLTMNPV